MDADATVFIGGPDGFGGDGSGVEGPAVVFDGGGGDGLKEGDEVLGGGISEAEKVEVLGRTVGGSAPEGEEDGAFDHKGVGMRGRGETIEPAFEGVANQELVVVEVGCASEVEQPLADGGSGVFSGHCSMSR